MLGSVSPAGRCHLLDELGLTARLKQRIAVASDAGAVQGSSITPPLDAVVIRMSHVRSGRHRRSVADGLVVLARNPEAMKQHGQLAGNCNDRPLLRCFPTAFCEPKSPAA
jgi:hypothetical protein